MDDQILLCDEKGNFTGKYIPKEVGHSGLGKRHLAITVLISNNKGEVLLQKRKHRVFDNIWDLTGATHPLHKDGSDETFEDATLRCLKREYNIPPITVRKLGAFNYFAQYGELCENEHCALMVGEYNGAINLNKDVGYTCRWVRKNKFLEDIEKNPQKYSPWGRVGVKILKRSGFFK